MKDDNDIQPLSDTEGLRLNARAKMNGKSVEELLSFVKSFALVTLEQIVTLSEAMRALENQDYDVRSLKSPGLLPWCLRVAKDQVVAELVVALHMKPAVLAAAARIPPADQKIIVREGTVFVAVHEDGETKGQNVPLDLLSRKQAAQVFAEGHIRTLAEQMVWRRQAADAQIRESSVEGIEVSPKRGIIVVTVPQSLSKRQLVKFLDEIG